MYVKQGKDAQPIVRYLIDSGACISYVKKSVIREYMDLEHFARTTKIAQDFNGNPNMAIGKCKIQFIVGAPVVSLPLWILESLHQDISLGSDAMEHIDRANCHLHFDWLLTLCK